MEDSQSTALEIMERDKEESPEEALLPRYQGHTREMDRWGEPPFIHTATFA